jgi:hypothetical protein
MTAPSEWESPPDDLAGRWARAREALLQAPNAGAGFWSELFELQNTVQDSVFGDALPLELQPHIDPHDARVVFVLDALSALSIVEPDDSALPWMRAGVLSRVGRFLEAADDFLLAAERFEAEHREGTGVTGDEHDWAAVALFHAARSLALGRHGLAAAALLPRLQPEFQAEIRQLVHQVDVSDGLVGGV